MGKVRLFFTAVGTYSVILFTKSWARFLYRRALSKVDRAFPISKYTEAKFTEATHFSRVLTCTLGVDFDHFSSKKKTSPKELTFCLIGQLKERKGPMIAIQAIELLKPKYPQVQLLLAGDCNTKHGDECRRYVQTHGLEKNVLILGKVSDQELTEVYSKSIGNILPSINTKEGSFEGFGLIHLEANSMGIPSIGTRDSGNECAISDQVSGYLVKQNDAGDLAEKMESIIEIFLKGTYEDFAKNCVEFAKKNSWNRYFEKIESCY